MSVCVCASIHSMKPLPMHNSFGTSAHIFVLQDQTFNYRIYSNTSGGYY